ncbi:MAG: LysM peptidoglycan-binding domain-containing protein [Actinomycetota bacterium]|nr:LysM peptidoglycan-binding domain-containing protein [Actinomycetota bacterium]
MAQFNGVPGGGPLADRPWRLFVPAALVGVLIAVTIVVVFVSSSSPPHAPSADAVAAARSLPPYWTVRAGQTYTVISKKTGLTIDQLEELNPRVNPDALLPGTHVKLRADAPPLRRPRPRVASWVVRRGQTFSSISAKTGVDIGRIQALNPRVKPNVLVPGTRLRLRPGGG